MKKIKYSPEAVNLIAERMPDEFLKQFVMLWYGTDINKENLAEVLNYSVRQIERYSAKVRKMVEQMPDIVNGEVKHIDEPKKQRPYDISPEPLWCEDCKHFCNADMGGEGECDIDNHDTWYGCPICEKAELKFEIKKQTNYDRIRNMSVEELAEFMYETSDSCEPFCALTKNGKCNSFAGGKQTCIMGIKQYLKSEATE